MARRPRVELEGGSYHFITRGNDRQNIFHSREDHLKFLSLIAKQKARSPFLLYAYCLMTNHVHLLIERQAESVGTMMLDRRRMTAKDAFIHTARQNGANGVLIAEITGLSTSNISRRSDAARLRSQTDAKFRAAVERIPEDYNSKIATSQARPHFPRSTSSASGHLCLRLEPLNASGMSYQSVFRRHDRQT